MNHRTYSLTVNDDGTVTAQFGNEIKSVRIEVGDDNRGHVKVGFESGPILYALKNDHGDDDAVSVYSDGRDYLLGYHGAIKRIAVKDFDYANLPEIRRELEAYVKEHRQPDGHTSDGRPYWL